MSEDKPDIDERAAMGESWCDEHQLRWPHRVAKKGCPLCEEEKKKNPVLPTDPKRPDVKAIREAAKISSTIDPLKYDLVTVCDYTLDLERRHGEVLERELHLYSLLTGLVRAVEKRCADGHHTECPKVENCRAECNCGAQEVRIALTAAKAGVEGEK